MTKEIKPSLTVGGLKVTGILSILMGLLIGISAADDAYAFNGVVFIACLIAGIIVSLLLFGLAKLVQAANIYILLHTQELDEEELNSEHGLTERDTDN